jgi:hypothetical protein
MKAYSVPLALITAIDHYEEAEGDAIDQFIECLKCYFCFVQTDDVYGPQNGEYYLWVTKLDDNLWLTPWLIQQGQLDATELENFVPLPDANERLKSLGKLLNMKDALKFIAKNLKNGDLFTIKSMNCFSIHFTFGCQIGVIVPHEHNFWTTKANEILKYPCIENSSILTETDLFDS